MKALVFKDEVIQLEEQEFPVCDEMKWVDCTNLITIGDEYIDGTFKAKEIDNNLAKIQIIEQLRDVDNKSIRALRTNDTARLIQLEAEAITLRSQLND